MERELREYVRSHNVQSNVVDLLFSVYSGNSFSEYLSIFEKAVSQPSNLKDLIENLRVQFNLKLTSHIMIIMREFLLQSNFSVFTRDYVKRCCELVEYITKYLLAPKLGINVGHKPLGSVINELKKPKYAELISRDLINNLESFNRLIFCPAKHEAMESDEEHKYSQADAVVITFIAIKLAKQLYDLQRELK